METTKEHVTHLTQETAIEVSTGKLAARLEELEKAQRRADRERLEWEMALPVGRRCNVCRWDLGSIGRGGASARDNRPEYATGAHRPPARRRCQRRLGAVLEQKSVEGGESAIGSVEREAS